MTYKTWFIDAYVSAMIASLLHAFWMLWSGSGQAAAWWAVVIGVSPGLLFFARVYAAPIARTSAIMWPVFLGHGIGLAWLAATGSRAVWPWAEVLVAGVLGSALYQLWYSRFGRAPSAALAVGQRLPELRFEGADGRPVRTQDLPGALLLIFYRGNWCPLCMAQIEEVARQYKTLAERGVQTLLISSQPHDNTAALASKHQVPFHFLVDRDNAVARQLGIVALDGTPTSLRALGYDGDTAMPTVVLTDQHQRIVFCDETDNYRVRPEPEVFLKLLDGLPLVA